MKNFKILSTGLNLTAICYNISLTLLIYQKINKAPQWVTAISDSEGNISTRRFSYLRYTLTGFERNYRIKIHSKQFWSKQLFYTRAICSSATFINKYSFNPLFVTGFSDAEGCFTVWMRKKN